MSSLIPVATAMLGAVAMALAFPRTNAVLLAPAGAVALFWAWFGMSPKRAFWSGWLAGTVYFAITFSWFGETAGALIAPFGFLLALGPAIAEAFFGFALVGALCALAAQALTNGSRANRALVPLAAAAVFAFGEWFRSEGIGDIGVPFGSVGFTQVTSAFAPVAAFAGTYGVTFVVCTIGAYLAYALRLRAVRGSGVDAFAALAALAACVALAWALWPAHFAPPATYRVAAVQGNIPQNLKFAPGSLERALHAYETLTREAAATHPKLIVWPETVIPTALGESPRLRARLAALARAARAELVVGTFELAPEGEFNVLEFFRPDGTLERTYRKRLLVPFTEHVPYAMLRPLLGWIPWVADISNFSEGAQTQIVSIGGVRFGPIICWESAFSGLAAAEVRDGAAALIVSTDDAWFGTTAGPYQHAQIAQMRAIETGRWIVRAASTGISGIVTPGGAYTTATQLGERAIVSGAIGPPVPTLYGALGPLPFAVGFAAIYLAIVAAARLQFGAGSAKSRSRAAAGEGCTAAGDAS